MNKKQEQVTDQDMIDGGYMEGKKSFEHIVSEIQSNFSFEKVHKAMVATGWEWTMGYDEDPARGIKMERRGIPSLVTIQNAAFIMLKQTYDSGITHSSGGFTAGWDGDDMFLDFTLENWVVE